MGGAVEETWKLVLGQIRANGGSVQGVRPPQIPCHRTPGLHLDGASERIRRSSRHCCMCRRFLANYPTRAAVFSLISAKKQLYTSLLEAEFLHCVPSGENKVWTPARSGEKIRKGGFRNATKQMPLHRRISPDYCTARQCEARRGTLQVPSGRNEAIK